MLKIRKIKRNSRILFEKAFYQLEVKLKVLDDNFLFVGSSKDEIYQLEDEFFKRIEHLDLENQLNELKKHIEPTNSTILLEGKPYIPGSTLKGMIRFYLEHSFKENEEDEIYSCFIKQDRVQSKQEIRNFLTKFRYEHIPKEREKEETKPERRSKKLPVDFCKVCDLFGNTNLAARVVFLDAMPLNELKPEYKEIVAEHTDRKRLIPPRSEFSFKINLNNGSKEDLALLLIGMNLHNDGTLLMGMHKFSPKKNTLGELIQFGKVRLEITKVTKYLNNKNGFKELELNVDQFVKEIKEEINQKFINILRNIDHSFA